VLVPAHPPHRADLDLERTRKTAPSFLDATRHVLPNPVIPTNYNHVTHPERVGGITTALLDALTYAALSCQQTAKVHIP
jgi:hypothetical protein